MSWSVDRPMARQIQLTRRPEGALSADDFAARSVPIEPLVDGDYVVRNAWLSIDAATILRIGDLATGYLPPFALDSPMEGWAVGSVVESRSSRFQVGTPVLHNYGWRDHTVLSDRVTGWGAGEILDVGSGRSLRDYVGRLGTTGLTAWAGLVRVAAAKPGDVVYVSAGAGAVGGMVVQLAKARGHIVVASAGSADKVAYLIDELGADAAFSYRDGPVEAGLRAAAPDGIDVYFDNVGGTHLDAALQAMRAGGRVALCGAISTYAPDSTEPGVRNLFSAIAKGLTLKGFLARMYADDFDTARAEIAALVDAGTLRFPEVVSQGLDQAPAALLDLLHGGNIGKILVSLGI
jgi:NADPH-dependent curcumin reductase CurA